MQDSAARLTHQFLSVQGIRLHSVTQGEGPLIILLHGFPEFWYSWRHQIPVFAQTYKVVAVDLRGYNESDKPLPQSAYELSVLVEDIRGILEALGYDRCILCGHDWGGAIAWEFAYTYPNLLNRLIVLNLPHPALFKAGFFTPAQILKSWYIFLFQLPVLPEWLLSRDHGILIAKILSLSARGTNPFSPEDLAAYQQAATTPGALTAMLNYYRNLPRSILRSRQWGLLEVPTLLIWGEQDVALGRELTLGTHRYVRDLQIRYIPTCGHWVQQEAPQEVNQYILDWLASPLGDPQRPA
ncbi:alpha/beta fold hydrolase [Lyngbya confervoides]|uniref:Alpha/beta fold hydrolase n=1 Tax=Lyngbya confervoides BDU141951 TaxID=1574623 RepID=A0ABD4T0C6_9CYAN|nr:alpha/beta fold hydrolase [Lyngbya confervoides]MCM1982055.1 alpha/beta fold hydrolase [Lyngbya confervoides BDU141951]